MSGPRRRTLQELAEACSDETLFAPLTDGRVILTAPRKALEEALGISRASLWRRTQTLATAGLATDDGNLVVNLEAITERLQPRVVALPTQQTRQYQALLEERFETSITADGTPTFHHPDGRPATLSDIAEATGHRSRGTAHHHLRRLQAVSPSLADQPAHDDNLVASAAETAIESLALLASTATAAGRSGLAATVLSALDTVTRCVEISISSDALSNVAVSARPEPKRDAALREPERDANAAYAPPSSSMNESENDSSHRHDATTRDATRDVTATSLTGTEEAVPSCDRGFNDVPDWKPAEWDELVAPLSKTWAEITGTELRIDAYCIDACLVWPKSYVRRAVLRLVDDVKAGRNAQNPKGIINNPGGLLVVAAREGRTRYFPLKPPEVAADPELARQQFIAICRDRAIESLASGGDTFSLANAVLTMATVRNQGDAEALEVMVTAIHDEILDDERRQDFDEELATLLSTQLAWSNTDVTTIAAVIGERRKAQHA